MTGHTDEQLAEFAAWERASWETRAVPYADSFGVLTRGSTGALLDAAGVGAGTRVLDVGTGPGYVALAAAARGAVVAAADQSAPMVELARAAGVDAVVAPAEELPFDDGAFDAVVAGYLLNHLPRPQGAVRALARLLAPGGRLAVTVWDGPEENPALGLFGPVAAAAGLTSTAPPGPDSVALAEGDAMARLLGAVLAEPRVDRVRWSVTVEPGAWFDGVAAAAPRTGALLAAATPEQRAQVREQYVALALSRYGVGGGQVELPATAVLGSARR